MGKVSYNKIIASVVTIVVLGLLVYAGPAQAFELSLKVNGESVVEKGKKIELTATVDIDSGEALNIDYITLILEGKDNSEYVECMFDVTGKMKSGVNDACHGINIKKIPYPQIRKGYGYNYGYGYGYGYGIISKLSYEITIHTQKFKVGEYETGLKIIVNGEVFSEGGESITIKEKQKGKEKHEQQEQNQEQETNHDNNKEKNKNKQNENNGNSCGNVILDEEEEKPKIAKMCQNHPGCADAIKKGVDEDGCIIWECPENPPEKHEEKGNNGHSQGNSEGSSGNSNSVSSGGSQGSNSNSNSNSGNSNSGGKGKGKNK